MMMKMMTIADYDAYADVDNDGDYDNDYDDYDDYDDASCPCSVRSSAVRGVLGRKSSRFRRFI